MLNSKINISTMVFRRDRFGTDDWKAVARMVVDDLGKQKASLIAAGVAFFAMLALFPAITATISIFGYFANPFVVKQNMTLVQPFVPEDVFGLVDQQVSSLVNAESSTLGIASIVSLLLAIWSARAGITAMISGLNLLGHAYRQRNFFWNLIVAYMLTIMLIAVMLVALATVVIIPAILSFFPLGGYAGLIVDVARWALAVLTILIGIGLLYRYGPSRRRARSPVVTIGSVVASLLWIIASVCFSIYLANFNNYNEVYGSLGAVIALLMWFYLSAFVVLFGAALNAQIELRAIDVIRERFPELLEINSPLVREMAGERE